MFKICLKLLKPLNFVLQFYRGQIIGTAQYSLKLDPYFIIIHAGSYIGVVSNNVALSQQTVVPPTKFAQFAPAGEILDFMFAPAGEMLDSNSSEAAKLLHSFISSKSNPRLYVFNLK
ncbi:hypothetical protein ACFE04_009379 [Oxalis oulophora]